MFNNVNKKIQTNLRNNKVITLEFCYNIILKLLFKFEKSKQNDTN